MKPKLNVRMLRRIQKLILEEPKRLGMKTWIRRKDPKTEADAPQCGTVACIAGWAIVLYKMDKKGIELTKKKLPLSIARDDYERPSYSNGENAARILGIPVDEPSFLRLFSTDQWPDDLRFRYEDAEPASLERAQIASECIDRYIAEHRS